VGLDHRAASPVGAAVSVTATLRHVDGRHLRFEVVATHADGAVVGHGEVTRVVVDRDRFLARLA
jgi:predicted thioesterase